MKNYIKFFLLSMNLLICPIIPNAQESSESDDITSIANNFVDLLSKQDYSNASKRFDTTMKAVLPTEKFEEMWKSIIGQVGNFKKQIATRTEKSGPYDIVFVTCEFEKANLDIKIVFNNAKEIAGLFFAPAQSVFEYKAPGYVKQDSFKEKEVVVGSGEWAVHGTLTIPVGKTPFPAVILVHGSGPNDRDETVGQNKPFRDLALGLASKGVAVLRYEKRTKEHSMKFASIKDTLTVKEETIDDVLLAVSLLQNTAEIDKSKIFVLGHSLGGMLIPRIGLLNSNIAGFIIMAGSTRPLEDITLEQVSYIFSLDGSISEEEKAQLETLKQQVDKIKDPNLSDKTPAKELPFGIPANYWLDLRGYKPAEVAKQLKQPMLILQGERDYQVTMVDFENWKKSLSTRKDVEFKSYPNLNHLFIEGEGKSTPNEYQTAGHISEVVVVDIIDWIKR
jgi:hypothetical protein